MTATRDDYWTHWFGALFASLIGAGIAAWVGAPGWGVFLVWWLGFQIMRRGAYPL